MYVPPSFVTFYFSTIQAQRGKRSFSFHRPGKFQQLAQRMRAKVNITHRIELMLIAIHSHTN